MAGCCGPAVTGALGAGELYGPPQYHHAGSGLIMIPGGKAVVNRSLNLSSLRSHSKFLSIASPLSSGVPACLT